MIVQTDQNWQGIIDNIEDSLFAFGKDLLVLSVNAKMVADFRTAFGVELKKGGHVLENVMEPLYSKWYERYQRVLNGESFDVIDHFEIENTPEFIKVSFKPLFNNGEIIGGTCHSRDISIRRKAEQQLLENELHLSAQIDNTNESIWSVDREIRILTINVIFQTNFNMAFGHVLQKGDCVLDYLEGELREIWRLRYNRALGGEHFTETDKFEFPDFLQFVEVSFNPILVENEIVGVAGFTKDITENVLKQIELEEALKKAQESDRLKSAFVANISHEIRSPLNSILGFGDLAFDNDYNEQQKAIFQENMLNSGAHLMDVIDGIIDISLIESGQLNIEKEPFHIRQLLTNCIEQIKGMQKPSDPEILLTDCPDIKINTDAKRVRQVLINLLTNGNKFTSKGAVYAGYTLDEDFIRFCVRDTGIGIPPEIGDKLFDRFYRVNAVKEVTSGTGLGLAISKAIVEALGGQIGYESELGKGTSFYFTLPLH